MKLIHRFGYYLGGFSIGLIILAFFLSGKKTSCAYGPNARVIKNINLKHYNYSNIALINMQEFKIDSTQLLKLIKSGNIDFSQSETTSEPCKRYLIENEWKNLEIAIWVENCDSVATIESLSQAKD